MMFLHGPHHIPGRKGSFTSAVLKIGETDASVYHGNPIVQVGETVALALPTNVNAAAIAIAIVIALVFITFSFL